MEKELGEIGGLSSALIDNAVLKLAIQDNMELVFRRFKGVIQSENLQFRERMGQLDLRLLPEFRDKGPTEVELKIAGDVLVFSLLNGVFQFDRNHIIWKTDYVKKNPATAYCGIINIYNFLEDSFKFNRHEDLGYLIGRVFVNVEGAFYVEGKRQTAFLSKEFGSRAIQEDDMRAIIETSVNYALSFDLLVPPYDDMKIITVEMIRQKMESSKTKTGKRLGFKFNSDDIS